MTALLPCPRSEKCGVHAPDEIVAIKVSDDPAPSNTTSAVEPKNGLLHVSVTLFWQVIYHEQMKCLILPFESFTVSIAVGVGVPAIANEEHIKNRAINNFIVVILLHLP